MWRFTMKVRLPYSTKQIEAYAIEEEGWLVINIDIAPDGTVYGVELLNANEQLTRDQGALIVESGGQRREIALVA